MQAQGLPTHIAHPTPLRQAAFLYACAKIGIYGTQDEKVKNSLKDNELLNMFTKLQSLSNKQQDTVKDLISAFILKADLQKNLAAK